MSANIRGICPGYRQTSLAAVSRAYATDISRYPRALATDITQHNTTHREPPEVDLTWLLRGPYSFIPPVPFRGQCQLSPTALSDWLQSRASIPAQAIYEARWGVHFMPGGASPWTGST